MTPYTRNAVLVKHLRRHIGQTVELQGWVANRRDSKVRTFIVFRDGTGFVQCVVEHDRVGDEIFALSRKLGLESSIYLRGTVVEAPRQMGGVEVHVDELKVYQLVQDYPIAKKEHGVDFLMDRRHLWLRSRRQWAVMQIRHRIIAAIHRYFQAHDFVEADAPIFTGNACEGTTTLFATQFYDDVAYLTQSGQLYGEAMAMALGRIYTFGPTFRAEKSKTRRHLSEFWMVEPEMAFFDLEMTMDLIEDFIRTVTLEVVDQSPAELEILGRDAGPLRAVEKPFERLEYERAVAILRGDERVNGRTAVDVWEEEAQTVREAIEETNARIDELEAILRQPMKEKKRNYYLAELTRAKARLHQLVERQKNIPAWIESARGFQFGNDFGGADETVLTRLFDRPVMVYNWPKAIKAFYMKEVPGRPDLVKGVDLLAPEGYGEIIGGGERETDEAALRARIREEGLPEEAFEWYLDLRRFGSVPHAGFGLGLERYVAWICKLPHVRETIPFPRMYGRLFP